MQLLVQFLKLSILISFTGINSTPINAQLFLPKPSTVSQLSTRSNSINYKPPTPPRRVGSPGRRSDGGSRTGCGSSFSKPLTALVPIYAPDTSGLVFGTTTAEHPTFWFYVPYEVPVTGTFQLRDVNNKVLYEIPVALPGKSSIIRFTAPDSSPSLEVGTLYHWYFKVSCEAGTDFVDGWIQRNSLSSTLQRQLEQGMLSERSHLYAENGIWFEALAAAEELRRTNPNSQEWTTLLKTIGLAEIASESIADCCKAISRKQITPMSTILLRANGHSPLTRRYIVPQKSSKAGDR